MISNTAVISNNLSETYAIYEIMFKPDCAYIAAIFAAVFAEVPRITSTVRTVVSLTAS